MAKPKVINILLHAYFSALDITLEEIWKDYHTMKLLGNARNNTQKYLGNVEIILKSTTFEEALEQIAPIVKKYTEIDKLCKFCDMADKWNFLFLSTANIYLHKSENECTGIRPYFEMGEMRLLQADYAKATEWFEAGIKLNTQCALRLLQLDHNEMQDKEKS